jgi:hypothetical protein
MFLSYRTLVVYLMSLDPVPAVPFPLLPPPPSQFLFWCFAIFLFSLFLCFLGFFFFFFFCSFCRSSPRRFHCPPSIARLFSCPHRDELPSCSSLYRINIHVIGFFPCISFCLYSVMLLFFSLYFVCYLLIIILWPRWFDWIPFDPDLCVVDMYVTLSFGSRRKNGLDFCVVDECISWLNCRGG